MELSRDARDLLERFVRSQERIAEMFERSIASSEAIAESWRVDNEMKRQDAEDRRRWRAEDLERIERQRQEDRAQYERDRADDREYQEAARQREYDRIWNRKSGDQA